MPSGSFHWPYLPAELFDHVPGNADFESPASFAPNEALWSDQFRSLENLMATQVFTRVAGTLDGAGNAALAHGIGGPFSTVMVQAFYRGATADVATVCPVTSVDAANVNVAAGAGGAGKACLVTLVYSIVPPPW